MRIGTLAEMLGTTPHAIRFYERRGLLPVPDRSRNRYRDYTEADAERLRLLIGLRNLNIPLDQAAVLAATCAGRYNDVSEELRALLVAKRQELARRVAEMRFVDRRMAQVAGQLAAGATPRPVISLGKEDEHAPSLS